MSRLRRWVQALVVVAGLLMLQTVAFSAPAKTVETIELAGEKNNIQIIVKGEAGLAFTADLEMPDGTIYKHQDYDLSKVMFIDMSDAHKIWIINVAQSGTYKLHLEGEAQTYTVYTEDAMERPSVNWVSPMNTQFPDNQSIALAWEIKGNYSPDDQIYFYAKDLNGWSCWSLALL